MSHAALEGFKAYWETLTPETVASLEKAYTPDAYFRDPFNEVRGHEAIRRIFLHMYETMHEPRFHIRETVLEGSNAFLVWDFTFRVKKWKPDLTQTIHGSSHIRFGPDGRATYHRDYWDAANELYAKLPVIGGLMRWLAKKMA